MESELLDDKLCLFLDLLSQTYFKDPSKSLKTQWKVYQKSLEASQSAQKNALVTRVAYHSQPVVSESREKSEKKAANQRVTNSQIIKSPPRIKNYDIYMPNEKQTPSTDIKSNSEIKENSSSMASVAMSQENIEKKRLESLEQLINPKNFPMEARVETKEAPAVKERAEAKAPEYRMFDVVGLKELAAYVGEKGKHVISRLSEENSQMTFLRMPSSSPIMSAFLVILIKQMSTNALFSENPGLFYNQMQELSLRFLHKKDLRNHDKLLKHLGRINKVKDYNFKTSREVLKNIYLKLATEQDFYEMFMLLLKYIVVYFVIEAKVASKANMSKTTENLTKRLVEIKKTASATPNNPNSQEEECLVFLANTFNKIINMYDVDSSECNKYMPSVFLDQIAPGLLKREIIDKCIMVKLMNQDKKEVFLEIPSSERVNFDLVAEQRTVERGFKEKYAKDSDDLNEKKHRYSKSYEKDHLMTIGNELTSLLSTLGKNSKRIEEIVSTPSKAQEEATQRPLAVASESKKFEKLLETSKQTRIKSPLTVEKIMQEANSKKKQRKPEAPLFEPFVRRRDSSMRQKSPQAIVGHNPDTSLVLNTAFSNAYGQFNSSYIPSTIGLGSQESQKLPNTYFDFKKDNIKPATTTSSLSSFNSGIWTSSLSSRNPVSYVPQTTKYSSQFSGGYMPVSSMNNGLGKTGF